MKRSLLILGLSVFFATFATAGSPADTTLAATKGEICVFGKMYHAVDVSFTVTGRFVYANTPEKKFVVWETPNLDEPSPKVSAKTIAEDQFMDAVTDSILQMRKQGLSRDQMNARLKNFPGSLADSVVVNPAGTFMIWWGGEAGVEVVEIGGSSGSGPDLARATPESVHKGLLLYTKIMVDALNQDAVIFLSAPSRQYTQPEQLTFTDLRKKQALFEVIEVLQGKTTGLHLLTAKVANELRKQ